MSTTTIRLPPHLKERVARAAEIAGTTAHSFILAAIAEKAVKDGASGPDAGSAWYVLGAFGLLSGAALIRRGAADKWKHPLRDGVLGGFSAGAGLALLALLEIPKRGEGDEKKGEAPSLAARVVASVPFKIKKAAVAGAVKEGGVEAVREVRDKLRESVH